MYILTLWTDPGLHSAMNKLRVQYFPSHLNKLEAHITLFHALPESKLQPEVLPAIEELAARTAKFEVAATSPFKIKKGIAIGFPKDHGGNGSRSIHRTLVEQWKDFVSSQDSHFNAHYTVMNKVDDQGKVDEAFQEVQSGFKAYFGEAEGLSLWKYHRSGWEHVRNLEFRGVG